jgi:putative membrane protein
MFQDYGYMGGMHTFWWIFWVVLVIVIVIYWGRDGVSADRASPRQTPLDVLRERLAKGEIDAKEYEERKAILDRDS